MCKFRYFEAQRWMAGLIEFDEDEKNRWISASSNMNQRPNLINITSRVDPNKLIHYRIRAAQMGCIDSMRLIAFQYFRGTFLSSDSTKEERLKEGIKWIKNAMNHGDFFAIRWMAVHMIQGGPYAKDGVIPKDPETGKSWLQKAASMGDTKASEMLLRRDLC